MISNEGFAKEYLSQIRKIDSNIKKKSSELYQLKTMATSITVASDNERVQSSGSQDRLGNTVAKIVDAERAIDRMVDEYIDRKRVIINEICSISDDRYNDLLYYRYVSNMNFSEIANVMHMSERHILRLHGEALKAFYDEIIRKC